MADNINSKTKIIYRAATSEAVTWKRSADTLPFTTPTKESHGIMDQAVTFFVLQSHTPALHALLNHL